MSRCHSPRWCFRYTSENPTTCAGKAGSYHHELQDAASYCAWGVDYLKVDHCGDGVHSWPHMNVSWVLFRQGFDKCVASRTDRKRMLLSVEYCTVDVPTCASWFERGGANSLAGCSAWLEQARVDLWRVKSDIRPNWSSILAGASCSSQSRELSANMSASTRGFNDPDIMEVGNPKLSHTEQQSHYSLWVILTAPLLISTNLNTISNATLALLTNKEVIAVNQDPLGIQGLEVKCAAVAINSNTSMAAQAQTGAGAGAGAASGPRAWLTPLSSGAASADGAEKQWALLLLNVDSAPQNITVTWAELGLGNSGTVLKVRDLWKHTNTIEQGFYSAKTAGHGVTLVTLTASV